ncbi:ABC transporter ATP-binding protein [Luteimonas mephitis]|uniref:ABC transporter ATP-binding protein n=1 Tax=Luteimonas mephitis TaxID=83615 RepID=UPI000407A2F9|nr:ATP-binding cassette domain-containing protein [Luteimonas mephitis]
MTAHVLVDGLSLDVPAFLQRERTSSGWGGLFFGAAFDPPKRQLLRLLDNISFELREGDRLAILGRNGAGKSTLLRVLNRVYQPSEGRLVVDGSCQALLNISLGFNGEATVRENVYLRGIAMGLSAAFLRGQIDQILEFSGLREKVNHRLRTLSSGQKMRLGFAISTSVQHDIIMMDEWVGAGDADFMRKAKERMQSRVGGSKIVVLASHSTGLLRDICNRGIVLERGRLMFSGDITASLKYYHELLAKLRSDGEASLDMPESRGAQIFGAVEAIAVERDACVIRGWFVDTEGAVPSGLALQLNGQRHAASTIERIRRPDVKRHFGLSNDECGFLATVPLPASFITVAELGAAEARILAGATAEYTHTPLRIAASVANQLKPAS